MKRIEVRDESIDTGPIHITKRGKRVLGGIMLAAAAATTVLVASNEGLPNNHKFTHEQLNTMEKESVTVQPGEGPDQIVKDVESELAGDQQGFSDVSDFVQEQGLIKHDGINTLESGQLVEVPLISGIPHNLNIK